MAEKYAKWQVYYFDEVTSTNDIIKNLCTRPNEQYVVCAKKQTNGRGRMGRKWQSLEGNLFFSLALNVDMQSLGMFILMCDLTLCHIIRHLQPTAAVQIKWPNDVLLNNAKVSGMLLEKGPADYLIIGIGVNLIWHPTTSDIAYPTTSLKDTGINITAKQFLKLFLSQFTKNSVLLETKKGCDVLRNQWLGYVKGLGKIVTIHQENKEISGVFKGIDENGYLMLENETGICQIRAGDVFFVEEI